MDTPSTLEGQPSLGSLLGSGAGRTGKHDRPFPDVGWEQHKGESCPQLSHRVGTSPWSSLGSAQDQPSTDPRPERGLLDAFNTSVSAQNLLEASARRAHPIPHSGGAE